MGVVLQCSTVSKEAEQNCEIITFFFFNVNIWKAKPTLGFTSVPSSAHLQEAIFDFFFYFLECEYILIPLYPGESIIEF